MSILFMGCPALKVLEAMGQKPTEEELFQMISEVDDNMSGSIDFPEFLKVMGLCNRRTSPASVALTRLRLNEEGHIAALGLHAVGDRVVECTCSAKVYKRNA